MSELPPPGSGLFLEVSFRRLLASCEDIVAGTSTERPDLIENWQHSPVFHHYVETLQEQLGDLDASAGSRLPRELLQQYSKHVEALASQLKQPDVPAFCTVLRGQQHQLPLHQPGSVAAAAGAAAGAASASRPPIATPAPVALTPQLPPKSAAAAAAAHARAELRPQAAAAAAAAANARAELRPQAAAAAAAPEGAAPRNSQSRLQTHQQLHEDLTEELAGLAAQLKSNTLAIEGRLKERGRLLDSTESALDTSLQKTKASKESATHIHRRGRTNLCLTCLVMLLVGLLFAGMYVFIKMTRLAGYRATPRVPSTAIPAPPAPADVPTYEQHYDL